jgi:DNA primase
LHDRKLKLETIKKFRIGYSPNVPLALKKYVVDKKKFSLEDLERAGTLYHGNSGFVDRFRGRVIFPLSDHRGNIVAFAGRTLPDASKDLAKYINSPETPIYSKSNVLYGLSLSRKEIKDKGFAIVVEGELDTISTWQVGITNAVAIKGSALTLPQLKLLSRFSQNITLALDADAAGDTAMRRGITLAENEGFVVKVAQLTNYKDPDEAAHKNPEKLKELIENALDAWDFFIDSVFKRYSSSTAEGRKKITTELVPILASIEDKISQAHYAGLIARKLSVPVEAVMQEVARLVKVESGRTITTVLETKKPDRRDLLEKNLLSLIFRIDPALVGTPEIKSLVTSVLARKIITEASRAFKKLKHFDVGKFAKGLPPELKEGFSDIILSEIPGIEDDRGDLERELESVKKELREIILKEKLAELSNKIKTLEVSQDRAKSKKAQEEFAKLTQSISKHRQV